MQLLNRPSRPSMEPPQSGGNTKTHVAEPNTKMCFMTWAEPLMNIDGKPLNMSKLWHGNAWVYGMDDMISTISDRANNKTEQAGATRPACTGQRFSVSPFQKDLPKGSNYAWLSHFSVTFCYLILPGTWKSIPEVALPVVMPRLSWYCLVLGITKTMDDDAFGVSRKTL